MCGGKTANLLKLAAPADKTEHDTRIRSQHPRSLEQRVQRVTRAVVSGIHHYILAFQPMASAEMGTPSGIEAHRLIVRPGWNDRNGVRRYSLGGEALLHEAVESDHVRRGTQAEAQQCAKKFFWHRTLPQPTGGNSLVGIQVHHPKHQLSALELHKRGSQC